MKKLKTFYQSELSVSDWENLLQDKDIFTKDVLIVLKRIKHVATPTNSAKLATVFGGSTLYYSNQIYNAAKKIKDKLQLLVKNECVWAILLDGYEGEITEKVFVLLPELNEALENIDLSDIPLKNDK